MYPFAPRLRRSRRVAACFWTTALLAVLLPHLASAQVIRTSHSPYLRLGSGASVSETDAATYAVEMYSLHGEIGYQFNAALGTGLGVTYADYPKANDRNTRMTTLQGLFRWTLFPKSSATPYFNFGGQATLGGDNPAAGGVFGLGVDYVVSRRTSIFAEATAYATFPDAAIDSRDDGRATFDGLGFWGAGVRTSLRRAPHPPELLPIEAPDAIYRGTPAAFTVRVSDETSAPVRYTWSFGDGNTSGGMVAENVYRLEGSYPVTVTATNAAGSDRRTLNVRVGEPSAPAVVAGLQADTLTVTTRQLIRFTAQVRGTGPVDMSWDFGDGTAPAVGTTAHRYDGERFIGMVQSRLSQGYVYEQPGTYTVTLTAANAFGTGDRSLVVEVRPGLEPLLARLPADGCERAQRPDTVYFAFDSDELTAVSQEKLRLKLDHLSQCPNTLVRLDGYADYVGSASYNRPLSQRRAERVRDYYVNNGFDADRFIARGNGEIAPPCRPGAAAGDKGCQSFRRVESVIVVEDAVADASGSQPVRRVRADLVRAEAEDGPRWALVVASLADARRAEAAATAFRRTFPELAEEVRVRHDASGRYRVLLRTFDSPYAALALQRRYGTDLPADAWLLKIGAENRSIWAEN